MRWENLKQITEIIKKAEVPFSPKIIYNQSSLSMSYKTFLRGVIILMKRRDIYGTKISHGRGRGINWIITRNELVEDKEKAKVKSVSY